jgi:hypothetical protein
VRPGQTKKLGYQDSNLEQKNGSKPQSADAPLQQVPRNLAEIVGFIIRALTGRYGLFLAQEKVYGTQSGASPALHQRSGLATAGKQTVSHECDAFSSADLAEPVPLVKLHADDVLREDAGLDGPNPLTFSRLI